MYFRLDLYEVVNFPQTLELKTLYFLLSPIVFERNILDCPSGGNVVLFQSHCEKSFSRSIN